MLRSTKSFFLAVFFLISCSQENAEPRLYFFLDPECPLSQNYSATIEDIYQEYRQKLAVIAVYSGPYIPEQQIEKFHREYDLNMPYIQDKQLEIANIFRATVTPEAILVVNDSIYYQGGIDNFSSGLGQTRRVVTRHYLMEALDAFLSGDSIAVPRTRAIGCVIEGASK